MSGVNLTTMMLIAAVIVVVMIAGIMLYLVRDRLLRGEYSEPSETGGILETMRNMRDRGEISEEEYRTAQAAIVAKASAQRTTALSGPEKARTKQEQKGELRAPPGFDLTGERLPPVVGGGLEQNERDFD